MARILRTSPHPVTIVATGPLTNVALLLAGHGALAAKIERIVIMGAVMLGNWTAAAEFNIFVDPEAADRVFKSGIPITMAGLDVTHQAQVMDEDIDRIRQLNNPVADVVAGLLDFFMLYHRQKRWGFQGAPLHDPCTIALLLAPELFTSIERWVGIETRGEYTQGMTVVDYYQLTDNVPNAEVLMGIDRKGFIDLLVERVARYSE